MARKFYSVSSHVLTLASAPVTAVPFSMACWFNARSNAASQNLITIEVAGSTANRHDLVAVQGNSVNAESKITGTAARATTTVGYSNNVWNHACGVWASITSRAVYLNGGNKGTDATSKAPSGINETKIGNGNLGDMDGLIAEAAIWNAALTDGEVKALALGTRPIFIRPMSLVAYWPLLQRFAPEIDVTSSGTNLMAVTGALSVPYNPPAVFYPRRKRYFVSAAVAPIFQPLNINQAVVRSNYW